ncbi:MAG: adenylate/guanylate cyclase domain-containing protein [Chloroflexi bacterium]|nr:adenylate/guanylate cyclase domain-containing protein [Chloroflexota bacterium]
MAETHIPTQENAAPRLGMPALFGRLERLLWNVAAEPGDTDETRLQKASFLAAMSLVATLAVLWGVIYLLFGAVVAAAIPLSYTVVFFLSLGTIKLFPSYAAFRTFQLFLMLFLPFLLMLALGGFVTSSAVITWSLLAPLAAVLFTGPRQGLLWFAAFVLLLVLGVVLEPVMQRESEIPLVVRNIFFAMNLGAPSLTAIGLVLYFFSQRNAALAALLKEQAKSEQLLLNVLPKEIAEQLKNGQSTVAEDFEAVSVLFADIVGSTGLAMELPPQQLVDTLNELFSKFDSMVEKYGLEKIRTMGDSYMVASGVPKPREDHAQALASMALEMRDYLLACPSNTKEPLQFRIDINSGPAIAGIIGHTKFHYDIWGDAVNTASRMESHGVPGRVQISQATYELLKDDFTCEPRGVIDIKGKDEMETWFLEVPLT